MYLERNLVLLYFNRNATSYGIKLQLAVRKKFRKTRNVFCMGSINSWVLSILFSCVCGNRFTNQGGALVVWVGVLNQGGALVVWVMVLYQGGALVMWVGVLNLIPSNYCFRVHSQ